MGIASGARAPGVGRAIKQIPRSIAMRSRILAAVMFPGVLLAAPGCATTPRAPASAQAPIAPGFAYSTGRGTQSFAAPPSAVFAALNESMNDLGLGSIRPTLNGTASRIEAK